MTDIAMEKHLFEKICMEILSVCLKTTKSTLLELYNVYLLTTSTQFNSFYPSPIKPGLSSLIVSNLNGHSQMWDPLQPPDSCGDEILNWIFDNNQYILNDSSATQTSQITGNNSTPNISLWVGAIDQQKHPAN